MRGQRNQTETTLTSRMESTGACEAYAFKSKTIISVTGKENIVMVQGKRTRGTMAWEGIQ